MSACGRWKLAAGMLLSCAASAGAVAQNHHAAVPAASSSTNATGSDSSMPDMPGMDMLDDKPIGTSQRSHRSQKAAPAHPAAATSKDHAGMSAQDMGHATSMPASPAPNDHISPPAPQHALASMSPGQMADMMQMNDQASRGMWLFDRLEHRDGAGGSSAWNAEGWWGNDLDRLWLKTEGEHDRHGTRDASVELLWSHAASTFWNGQLGVRHDFGQGPAREWFAAGVQGLTPYGVELAATLYAGSQGRTAARIEASYALHFTQRLILSPELELSLYGKDDPRREVRAGLSEMETGLRLRYEFSRCFAPYVGIERTHRYGRFDNTLRAEPARETSWVVGVRLWF